MHPAKMLPTVGSVVVVVTLGIAMFRLWQFSSQGAPTKADDDSQGAEPELHLDFPEIKGRVEYGGGVRCRVIHLDYPRIAEG